MYEDDENARNAERLAHNEIPSKRNGHALREAKDISTSESTIPETGDQTPDKGRSSQSYDELNEAEKGDLDAVTANVNPPAAPSDNAKPQLSNARICLLVATVTGAAFLNTFSVQAAVIILPTIGRALDIPSARQQWVVSAYSLTFGCFLLLWGRLADVYGKRMIFIYGSAWVCICTLVSPFLPNEIAFDLFRGLQGLGAAANVPTAIGILGVTLPPGKAKTYAFATYGAGAPMGSVLGNIIGGVVGQYAGWKWMFWILAILAALVTVAGHFFIPPPPAHIAALKPMTAKRNVDWIGGAVITIALLLLLIALTEGNILGWATPWIPVFIVLSIILIGAFIWWQIYLSKTGKWRPLIKLSIFKNSKISAAMAVMGLMFSSFNSFLVFTTFFFQDYQGHNPIETAIRFIPTGVAGLLTVILLSRLIPRVKLHHLLIGGMVCCTLSSLLFALPFPPHEIYWAYSFPALSLAVIGVDTVFTSMLLFVAQSLPQEDQAMGGAMINAIAQVGRSLGLAIATAIQVAVQKNKGDSGLAIADAPSLDNASFLAGLRGAHWFDMAQAAVGLLVAVWFFRGTGKLGPKK